MGMFDTVVVKCPHCVEDVEMQTKTGPCVLDVYTIDNLEMSVAVGVIGVNHCHNCHGAFKIELETQPKFVVKKLNNEWGE